MYKYLIFDLDDTLLDFKKAERVAIGQVLKEFNVDNSDKTVEIYSLINKSFWERFEKGEIKREDIFEGRFKEFARFLHLDLDTRKMCDRYFEALSLYGFVFDGAVELLEALKDRYTLCAATNGTLSIQKSRLEDSKISHFFNGGIYISEALGTKKPEKKFFDIILNELGNPAKSEVLVLGDSLSSDILGAKNAGLDSCFVNLRNQAINEHINPTYTVTSLKDIPPVCGL
jgi:2-haloacid dehalogenase